MGFSERFWESIPDAGPVAMVHRGTSDEEWMLEALREFREKFDTTLEELEELETKEEERELAAEEAKKAKATKKGKGRAKKTKTPKVR